MDPALLARLLAGGRVAIGLALFVAPRQAARRWIGDEVDRAGTRMALRGLGARDVALGVGLLAALEDGSATDRWLEAGAVADLADAWAVLLARDERPTDVVVATLGVAGGAAALGLWLRRRLPVTAA
ncbi:MAG: hypothetical protein KY461_15575 [Actinobacteria bacterium]|nr:hypothetical protein [Actinomycetota bacterium]